MKKHLNKTMVEFVLEKTKEITNEWSEDDQIRVLDSIDDYANALSQTPRLGHFIRCDENDVPLEEPEKMKCANCPEKDGLDTCCLYEQYQQACDRVLFEGFKLNTFKESIYLEIDQSFIIDIERLKNITFEKLIDYNLPLTEAGAKTFGYEKTN